MALVTFQIIDGVDKGRVFQDLQTPVTIGREEGNTVRLNDERVSRFHAKVQQDHDDLILTDLESTNGTRVNGQLVQIHRLRHGDFVMMGRSVLLFGSMEEIAARQKSLNQAKGDGTEAATVGTGTIVAPGKTKPPSNSPERPTMMATAREAPHEDADLHFNISESDRVTNTGDVMIVGKNEFPPLPVRLTPSQSARLSEVFNFLHRAMATMTQTVHATDEGTRIYLDFAVWQRLLQIQMLLARYQRAITDPETWPQAETTKAQTSLQSPPPPTTMGQ
jgi:pSer/pThr/pTyr-binding forkhead associated (FHA) protein